MHAAFGHAERAFQGLDDVHEGDARGGTGEAVAAARAAETFHQPGLRQRLQHLGHGRRLEPGLLARPAALSTSPGRAASTVRTRVA